MARAASEMFIVLPLSLFTTSPLFFLYPLQTRSHGACSFEKEEITSAEKISAILSVQYLVLVAHRVVKSHLLVRWPQLPIPRSTISYRVLIYCWVLPFVDQLSSTRCCTEKGLSRLTATAK